MQRTGRPQMLARRSGLRLKPLCGFQRLAPMPRQTSPDLTLPLAEPITLTRGLCSHLVTLMDAAILIRDLEPFRQARPVRDRAKE
jgi:hypothetical protein